MLPFDLHCVHLESKCVQHVTPDVLYHVSILMFYEGGRGRGIGCTLASSSLLHKCPKMVMEDIFDCFIGLLVDISS